MADEAHAPKSATPITCAHNRSVLDALPFGDRADFEDARRGFIGSLPKVEFRNADGRVIYSLEDYAFLADEQAPDTVNPSLWRQARLNMNHGLFQVTDRIYQVRGFDISNMTIIEGARGVIVIDPLISAEIARAGLELYFQHRGRRPVTAVIYSHSHVDHFGGVRGVVDEADVKAGNVAVIAPDRFLEEVTKENVLAGTPMIRRAMFQFGGPLPKGPRGQVDAGLGKVTSRGTVTLIPPTQVIQDAVELHTIDGVEMIFQLTPDTEAPAEMHMFYPGLRALNLAENATHNLHNIYPIRGAQVRDANAWAKYLNEARDQFAPKADVVFAQHHWPVWGNARVLDYLAKQRDAYKYLHDQTLRLMNHGFKATEIAERMALPRSLEQEWHVRGYYGTFSHNSKSVYQRYLGWYDANPANLNPLPPVERARKAVAYMGGAEAAIGKGARGLRQGRIPLGRRRHEPGRVRRARQPRRARAVRRRAGAARLPGRVRNLAQRLPARRPRAAPRQVGCRPCLRAPAATSCAGCRSTCSSTSSACASTARRPRARPRSSTGSSPIPASAMRSPCRTAR